jgi:hypothetical protein
MSTAATTASLIKQLRLHAANGWANLTDEQLDQSLLHLELARAEQIDALSRQEVASFDAGPLYWLTRYTKTENPQYEQQGLPFIAPFPKKTYFIELFKAFLAKERQLFVCKSRTMMTSWAAAAYATWCGQWKQEETLVQCINEDRAQNLINYAGQLLRHQEPSLSRLHPIKRQSAFSIEWANGGAIDAIPGGANAARAFHPTLFILDEAAFIPEGEQSLNAVLPSNARIIAISTATAGWFGDACSL